MTISGGLVFVNLNRKSSTSTVQKKSCFPLLLLLKLGFHQMLPHLSDSLSVTM